MVGAALAGETLKADTAARYRAVNGDALATHSLARPCCHFAGDLAACAQLGVDATVSLAGEDPDCLATVTERVGRVRIDLLEPVARAGAEHLGELNEVAAGEHVPDRVSTVSSGHGAIAETAVDWECDDADAMQRLAVAGHEASDLASP